MERRKDWREGIQEEVRIERKATIVSYKALIGIIIA